MTAIPLSIQPSPLNNDRSGVNDASSVLALKEIVARLNREQNKIQDLLSSLGFALRSFNNLNQFLELIPLMASRVTDADGGALIMFRNGQVRLEQIHCQDQRWGQEVRQAFESAAKQITHSILKLQPTEALVRVPAAIASLDQQMEIGRAHV